MIADIMTGIPVSCVLRFLADDFWILMSECLKARNK
jgi:hypothetical protein